MQIVFKVLRVDILSKFFLKNILVENLIFSSWYPPITLGIQLGNKYFWGFSIENILSIKELLKASIFGNI